MTWRWVWRVTASIMKDFFRRNRVVMQPTSILADRVSASGTADLSDVGRSNQKL